MLVRHALDFYSQSNEANEHGGLRALLAQETAVRLGLSVAWPLAALPAAILKKRAESKKYAEEERLQREVNAVIALATPLGINLPETD